MQAQRRLITIILAALVAAALAGLFVVSRSDGAGPTPTQTFAPIPAPDFTLELLDGGTFHLADALAAGKAVVVNFWASWCGPCRTEMPGFETVSRERPDVAFVGVAVEDEKASAAAFAAEVGVTYALGLDEGGVIGALPGYERGFGALPFTVIIDPDGMIVSRNAGELTAGQLRELLDTRL